jgi:membrane protein
MAASTHPDGTRTGSARRDAGPPRSLGWSGWREAIRDTAAEMISDRVSLSSAGCAFFGTLALFPAISMLIFIYGLLFDPHTVEPQLDTLRELLPPAAFRLIAERVHVLVSRETTTLGTGLAISTLVTLWSSMTGTKAILSALNLASKRTEERGFLRFQLISLAFTLYTIIAAVLGIAILVGLPAAISFLGLTAHQKVLLHTGSMAMLLLFVGTAVSLLYRHGPSNMVPRRGWLTPGTLIATLLWVIASALFSFYVGHIASYDALYGPLAAVVGVMMWFWVSAYVVLLGAEIDAARERWLDAHADAPR